MQIAYFVVTLHLFFIFITNLEGLNFTLRSGLKFLQIMTKDSFLFKKIRQYFNFKLLIFQLYNDFTWNLVIFIYVKVVALVCYGTNGNKIKLK